MATDIGLTKPGASAPGFCFNRAEERHPQATGSTTMAKKPGTRAEFVFFDVLYEDGSRRSNRRVPSNVLGGLDADEPARAIIEQQDREIAERSGMPPVAIKSIERSRGK
jgi:hypothetical protein